MKKLVIILLFCCFSAFAQNESLFEEANDAYSSSNYKEAARKYGQILENGETSAELYYNLGNTYYKLEEVAPSVFYFEKALQLAPNDKDIKNNLAVAQQLRIDALPEQEATAFSNFLNAFSLNTLGWIAVGFSVLFLIFFILYYFSSSPKAKRLFFSVAIIGLIISVISVGFGFFQQAEIDENNYAIVFSEVVEVKNEPNESAEAIFALHEGSKIEIIGTFQEWSKIELPDEKQGWVKQEQLKSL